jgi:PAS domain S-box-containing protein
MKRIEDLFDRIVRGGSTSLNKAWTVTLDFIRRESLLRTVVVTLAVISLLPVIFFGTISYYRTRVQIQSLVSGQLKNVTDSGVKQIQDYATTRSTAIGTIAKDTQLTTMTNVLVHPEKSTPSEQTTAVFMIQNYLQTQSAASTSGEAVFDYIFLLDSVGNQVAANDSTWMYNTFGTLPPGDSSIIRPLINKGTSTTILYDPFAPYNNRFALITVNKFNLPNSNDFYYLVGVSSTRLPIIVLGQAAGFFPQASAYYYLKAKDQLIASKSETAMRILPNDPAVVKAIKPVIDGSQTLQPISFISFNKELVLAYIKEVPSLGLYLVLEVPTSVVFGNIPFLDTFNIYMLVLAFAILTGLAYLGTTQVVNPLLHLSKVAQGLAGGNFQLRANVKRRDEVGELANSMNHMAEELAALYATLEEKVEQRTGQLRAASEVAQLATSSSRMEDMLKKTVDLVSERFSFYHAAIYLTDETGAGIILREASGELGEVRVRRARRMLLTEENLACWVARNNKSRIVQDTSMDDSVLPEDVLPETHSEVALPIAIGNDVLGVLNVHSSTKNSFDADIVFVLQTLANQVAGALQNTRLLATAQVDLEETALLYKVTRQITESLDEKTIINILLETLPQLPHTNALMSMEGNSLHILGLYDARLHKYERNLSTIDIPVSRFQDALAPGQPIFVQDITQPTNFDNILSFFLRRGCKSAVILPSLQSGRISKVFVVGFREEDRVTQTILQPFTNLAEVVSTTLDKFTVLDSLQQRLSELQILANFGKAASSETDLNHLYFILHEQVKETLGSDVGFLIAILDPSKTCINIPYAYEGGEMTSLEPLPLGQGLTSYVIQNRAPLLLNKDTERRALELGAQIVGKAARSWMGVPLMVGGDLIGAMVLQDQIHDERFDDSDLNLFLTLAPQIATSIRNAQLVDEMQHALQAFEKERLLINTWLDNTPDLIIVKNAHGNYVRTSQSIANFFGVTADEAIGKSDFDIMVPEVAVQATESELKILQSRTAEFNEIEANARDGKKTWFLATKIPVINQHNESEGLLTIRRDITEMKTAEEGARRRAEEILTAAEIARDATSTLDISDLLNKAVNLVRERFGFYHSSIFLLDPLGKNALLRESTGEAGRQLKESGHKLAVGSKSIVGQATARGEGVIVNNVTNDPTYFPNPLLPNTQAELAIPLKIGDRILGALDVQSETINAFSDEDIAVLGILADQLAVAVNNADLFASTQDMLGKHRLLHQITVAASSSNSLGESLDRVVNGLVIAHVSDRAAIMLINRGELEVLAINGYEVTDLPSNRLPLGKGAFGLAAAERKPVLIRDAQNDQRYFELSKATRSGLALPIFFGDEILGVLNMESDRSAGFDANDQEIMTALVNNIGAIIANWRLVNQIRHQVERQQFLFSATAKIRRSVDIETILQTSVNEIGRAMGAQRAKITLSLDDAADKTQDNLSVRTDLTPPGGKNGKNGSNGSHQSNEVEK